MGALLVGQEVQRRLRAQQGAAQIHQNHDPVIAVNVVDGRHHFHGVGANGIVGIVDSPGHGQRHAPLGHLPGEFPNAFGQLGAMRYDD